MKKYIIIFLLFTVFINRSFGQSLDYPKIIPPSPDASAIGTYGGLTSSNNIGVVDFTMPLYEIKTSKLKIPITLSYGGGNGIKVDEMASWVGLGWVLNAGGIISRTIVGSDDMKGYFSNSIPFSSEIGTGTYNQEYLEKVIRGDIDTEPDYYYFSFNGKSGKFIFGTDGKPIFMDSSPFKLTYNFESGFLIVDDDGNNYSFNTKENVSSVTYSSLYPDNATFATSSWYLSNIISADKTDTIKFEYNVETTAIHNQSFNYSQSYGQRPDCSQILYYDEEEMSQNNRDYLPVRIRRILFKSGSVEFMSSNGRLDGGVSNLSNIEVLSNNSYSGLNKLKIFKFNTGYFYSNLHNPINDISSNKYRLKLNSVEETDSSGLNPKIHSFAYSEVNLPPVNNFGQDEWGYFNGSVQNTSLLKAQQILSPNGIINIGSANRNVSLENIEAGILKKIIYPSKGYTKFEYEPNKYVFSEQKSVQKSIVCGATAMTPTNKIVFTANNTSRTSLTVEFRRIGDLQGLVNRPFSKLTNLTTGVVVASYSADANNNINYTVPIGLVEGDQYELYSEAIGNQQAWAVLTMNYTTYENVSDVRNGFGLRINKVMDYDHNDALISTNTYKYGESESGVGIVISNIFNRMPTYYTKRLQVGYSQANPDGTSVGCKECAADRIIYFNGSAYPLTSLSGSPIAYNNVTIYSGDELNNIGKRSCQYLVFTDKSLPVSSGYPGTVMQLPYNWSNGKLLKESIFKYIQGGFRKIKEIKTDYKEFLGPEGRGLKVGYALFRSGCYQKPRAYSEYYYVDYPVYTGVRLPEKVTETFFQDDGLSIQTTTSKSFYYNSIYQEIKTETETSMNRVSMQETNRPLEMVNFNKDPDGVYQEMVLRNIVSPVIEQKRNDNDKIILIKNKFTRPYPNIYTQATLAVRNTVSGLDENRLEYMYNDRGSLISVKRSADLGSIYIWSYNSQYPVMEIKNADYAAVENLLGGAAAVSSFSNSSPTDAQVAVFLAPLRNGLPDAQITTYTYKPLVGMTSSTDAKGMTTYYEYDEFQRLKYIKDQYGNIIKNNAYHYKN